MAYDSFDDLLGALRDHPDWREELRRVLLTDALLGLPDQVAELVGAQARTEARVEELAQAQARTEARVEELTRAVTRLTQAQERTEARLESLIAQVESMAGHVEWLKGAVLEMRYRDRATAYFGPIARRLHVLTSDELEALLTSATDAAWLTEEEAQQLRLADVIARGRREGEEVFLVVEVSWGVGLEDMRRAQERAALLEKAGHSAFGVVAGTWVNADVGSAAPQVGVWQVANGRVVPPGGQAA